MSAVSVSVAVQLPSTEVSVVTITLEKTPKVVEFIEGGAWLIEEILSSDECDTIRHECQQYHADVQYGLSYCSKSCFDDSRMATYLQEKIQKAFAATSAPTATPEDHM